MKLSGFLIFIVTASLASAARKGCNIPLSKTDKGVKFTASSYDYGKEPYRARMDESKAWCAAKGTVKYRGYIQVELSTLRHVSAIEVQGAKWSFQEFYTKKYIVSYSLDGSKRSFRFYKTPTKTGKKVLPWTEFTGNTDATHLVKNEIHPSFVAKFIRIYPLEFKNEMCTKVEVYGCNESVDCTHVVKLNENQRVDIISPSYPLPYRNDAHCNWLIYLPKPHYPVSIFAMDFDVGGSAQDQESCARGVLKTYENIHPFSKYLNGTYCNNSARVMPREIKMTTDSMRISFTGGDNHIAQHRGFFIMLWATREEYKTAKACQNTAITLDCSNAEQDIEVISAFYGRRPNYPVCTAENGNTGNASFYTDSCKAPGALPKLKTICDYRNVCKIEINDENFPQECASGEPLEMFVVYHCNVTKRTSTMKPHETSPFESTSSSSRVINAVTTTTPPPTTTTAPPTTPAATTVAPESEDTSTPATHGATTKIVAQPAKGHNTTSIVLIAAVAGGVFVVILALIALITCVCCKRNRGNEKAQLAKKGVVPSERISELEMDVRYSEAEPNRYSPALSRDPRRGMSDNPLYQSSGPPKANSSYDLPSSARYTNQSHLNRPHSVGNPLKGPSVPITAAPTAAPTAPESNYIDVLQSPEELPSNSPPMVKYLVPSRNSPPDFRVTIPLDRCSDTIDSPTADSPLGGDDVYESMDGSNA
ncbi:uncharacterized protein LOC114519213 isoform X2 [Dendronephthya gigantea]|uniref:uncharacterized protein LOC114519213 isoform X2 n=1 Tax=Dendronephthya gigantea TaxID=151771 RepID=UPI00106CDE1E|nr:uncharacterized protein LOC114519213 isoform X2 [Dendronephthya gigantea]